MERERLMLSLSEGIQGNCLLQQLVLALSAAGLRPVGGAENLPQTPSSPPGQRLLSHHEERDRFVYLSG